MALDIGRIQRVSLVVGVLCVVIGASWLTLVVLFLTTGLRVLPLAVEVPVALVFLVLGVVLIRVRLGVMPPQAWEEPGPPEE